MSISTRTDALDWLDNKFGPANEDDEPSVEGIFAEVEYLAQVAAVVPGGDSDDHPYPLVWGTGEIQLHTLSQGDLDALQRIVDEMTDLRRKMREMGYEIDHYCTDRGLGCNFTKNVVPSELEQEVESVLAAVEALTVQYLRQTCVPREA